VGIVSWGEEANNPSALQSRPWSDRRDGIARSVCQNEKLFGTEYTQILISLTRSHSSSGTLVSDGMKIPEYLKKSYMPSGSITGSAGRKGGRLGALVGRA
jgi:hypothetical protein